MKIAAYNLFPSILGNIKNWCSHVERVKELGFTWIYINPITYSGFSGSLYAVKDYYAYNEMFFTNQKSAEKEIKEFLSFCAKNKMNVMMDLVINHSSKDSILTEKHKNWYKLDEEGELKSPGAWDNGVFVEWGDLASFDNEESEDLEGLWDYWNKLIKYNLELGFSGFRCDAAYKVTPKLWDELIKNAKKINKDVIFFAETLGCPIEDTIALSEVGFDYVASSAKWWDFEGDWFLPQYNEIIKYTKQVAFPENHDTERSIKESNGNIWHVKQNAFFTALISDMWMITSGFEYGFNNRCNVVGGNESDYEDINYDLSEYIKKLIKYFEQSDILKSSGIIEPINIIEEDYDEKKELDSQNNQNEKLENKIKSPFKLFYKYSQDEKEKCLIIVNTSEKIEYFTYDQKLNIKEDISFERKIKSINKDLESIEFLAFEIKVFNVEE